MLFLGVADARAQVGRVAGTITDDEGRPIKGATVTAENREQAPSTFTSSSDAKGRFSILGMRRGVWTFTIQAPGFEPTAGQVDVVTTRPNPPLNVRLIKGVTPLPPGPLAGMDVKEIQRRIDAAESLAASGDYKRALAEYQQLLTRIPALTSVYLRIGALHERLNDPAAALAAYERLVTLDPANASARSAIERLGKR